MKLADLYFGELEAFDEARNEADYFEKTFVLPESLSINSLRKNRKYIIVGRKGVGKTALQMYFAQNLAREGYFTTFFRFSEDLRASDFTELAKTQSHISYISAANNKNLFLSYDFRDIWERVILNRIAETLQNKKLENAFTRFVRPPGSLLRNIFDGISRSLTVKVSAEMLGIAGEIGFSASGSGIGDSISISEFNRIAKELFGKYCKGLKIYMFVDELVFSRLDGAADEVKIKAAMVRDVIKTVRELNSLCVERDLDIHFICTLRPEIRNTLNEFDSEIGKIVDGKDIIINWYTTGLDSSPLLLEVFRKKVEKSGLSIGIDAIKFEDFMASGVSFGRSRQPISEFIKSNTWGRPRDLVRLLNSISKCSPNALRMDEDRIKAGLDEYSRASAKELIDELSVKYGSRIYSALKKVLTKKTFDSKTDFLRRIPDVGVDEDKLFEELFLLGVIGGIQTDTGNFYWAHRGETFFKEQNQVRVHAALWNEFSIRGKA